MVNLDFEDNIENQIRLRVIMAKHSEDDLLVHSYMLKSLIDVYIKHKIEIPDNVLKYINQNIEKLKHELPFKIEEMKKELNNKVNSDDQKLFEKPIKYKEDNQGNSNFSSEEYQDLTISKKKRSLFPDGYFKK